MDIRKNTFLVLPNGEKVNILNVINCLKSTLYREKLDDEDSLTYELRKMRHYICFPVVDRGKLWYDDLTEEQYKELKDWRNSWLNVTETLVVPVTPSWINDGLKGDVIL